MRNLTKNNFVLMALLRGGLMIVLVGCCVSTMLAQEPTANDSQVVAPKKESQGQRITLTDGRTIIADEVWRRGNEVWYTQRGVTQSIASGVKSIEPLAASQPVAKADSTPKPMPDNKQVAWIHLVNGASFKVDEVTTTPAGVWYRRGIVSEFVASERVARIERSDVGSLKVEQKHSDWTSGNAGIDELIRVNGTRYGVDPYLVFCVIEHESHFKVRAVSRKGARGLMQLMPATARRFGVRRPFDPADNIDGGTQYLKKLMDMFGGQVSLVLASYNAGEGAVMKFGRNVPPYRETREYVKKISKRYGI